MLLAVLRGTKAGRDFVGGSVGGSAGEARLNVLDGNSLWTTDGFGEVGFVRRMGIGARGRGGAQALQRLQFTDAANPP